MRILNQLNNLQTGLLSLQKENISLLQNYLYLDFSSC